MAIKGLVIRAMELEDIDAVSALLNLPDVCYGTLQIPYTSHAYRRERMADVVAPDQRVALVAEVQGQVVGQAGLYVHEQRRRHSADVGMAVHAAWQGQGIGSALLQVLLDVADNWLGLVRVELTVYIDNVPAIGLYKKFGFEVEGTLRKFALRDGHYVDAYAMARIRQSIT